MSDTSELTLEIIRASLRLPRPGRAAQVSMSPRPRLGDRPDLPTNCPHQGAVLLLVYPLQLRGAWAIPLTQRTDKVELHKGQISFPGGAREPGDVDFAATALRETQEELGIAPGSIELLGTLTPLYIPSSSYCVYPFVGWTPRAFALHVASQEVAEVIEARLDVLLDPSTRHVEKRVLNGQTFEIPSYQVGSATVWGATAMILAEFLALLRRALCEKENGVHET